MRAKLMNYRHSCSWTLSADPWVSHRCFCFWKWWKLHGLFLTPSSKCQYSSRNMLLATKKKH